MGQYGNLPKLPINGAKKQPVPFGGTDCLFCLLEKEGETGVN
jgi:hypothetical protein